MRYFGSKVSTAQQVYRYIADRVPTGSFCDPFGGVGVIGAYFKERGYSVVSGDILTHAHFFQTARITRQRRPAFLRLRKELALESAEQVVELLNRAKRHDGWFVREYAEKRMFFTRSNAERIAGCRASIFAWAKQGLLSHSEKAVLVASLIDSMDRVANTAGTYYAYLKHWYRKAKQPFRFSLIPHTSGSRPCRAYLSDARDLVAGRHFDVLYLDPPYNDRCYAGYYHLPETIAQGLAPRVSGKAGIPCGPRVQSAFNRPANAFDALEELLHVASFRLLVFHYSDDGLITRSALLGLFRRYGAVHDVTVDAHGYTTRSKNRTVRQRLYLISHD